jgi:hypothetical protein
VRERTDASKERKDRDAALALARSVRKVVVSKGKKVVVFDMENAPPDDDTLVAYLLGPTGNLRAPALRRGQTLFVGFNADAYTQHLD